MVRPVRGRGRRSACRDIRGGSGGCVRSRNRRSGRRRDWLRRAKWRGHRGRLGGNGRRRLGGYGWWFWCGDRGHVWGCGDGGLWCSDRWFWCDGGRRLWRGCWRRYGRLWRCRDGRCWGNGCRRWGRGDGRGRWGDGRGRLGWGSGFDDGGDGRSGGGRLDRCCLRGVALPPVVVDVLALMAFTTIGGPPVVQATALQPLPDALCLPTPAGLRLDTRP